ncbi:hypothetical protein D3872_14985 [Massilia cavernae]|uniref:Uncharacterized protein n=2 Tax=Massilia cavernae TaxID=2320864 RepID=A0A418XRD0_9BURK|nr:hypothetical protein D3872_14985 [Massilia cavernae]
MGGQLAPQGFFGGLLGAPLGGAIGRGIGGLFGSSGLGNQIGQFAGGIGGSLLPFGVDPVTAAYAQQAQQQQLMQQLQQQQSGQLAPQGWFGNLIGQVGQPLGGAIGGMFGNPQAGSTIGNVAGQLGRLLPFGADPISAAYAQQMQQAQQQQLAPQGWFGNLLGQVGQPLGGAIGGLFGNQGVGSTIGGAAGQLGRLLPFGADPVAAAYAQQIQQAQQQQLAPQGWLGNMIGQVGQPLGSTIGGWLGNAGVGSTIGGVAGQLGKLLPFGAEPQGMGGIQQIQQLQQQLQQQVQQLHQQYQQQLAQLIAQQQQQQAQQLQGQLGPQGWFGNLIGQVGRPLGGAIGGLFGNAQLGNTIGGAAGQLGQMLPFSVDPMAAAYAQQAQLAAQQGMPQYSPQQTLH